jgi:predicted nucleotidyltransferase
VGLRSWGVRRKKALAFHSRGENKDAYDLAYVLQSYEGRADAVGKRLAQVRASEEAAQALEELERDFTSVDSVGPVRVSEFLYGARNDVAEAEARGSVRDLIDELR